MSALFPSVAEAFPRVTKPLEGCVLWPYLDVFGLATVGYGCLVDSVLEFRKPDWSSDGLGHRTQLVLPYIDDQRARLKSKTKALHFKLYESATTLRLTQDRADVLLVSRAEEFAAYMARVHFSDWDTWPADAQLAWMLIAWACGPGAPTVFKTAAGLCNAGDFEGARKWAKIKVGTRGDADYNPGIVPRNAQIDLCLANAAAIHTPGYATPALYWPGHVEEARAETLPEAARAAAAMASYDVNDDDCGRTGRRHLPDAA